MKQLTLSDAVERHIHHGDAVQILCGHCRWSAAAREMARQFWGTDAGFTLIMVSLSSLGALFFRGNMVRKVVTTYSGDTFPTYTPNPVFQKAYASGAVDVEHWSILTFTQRLEAAARGLPAIVTGSLDGSSMAGNDAFATADDALRRRRSARPPRPRRHPRPRGRGRRGRERGVVGAAARGGVGSVGGPPRRHRHRGARGGEPRRTRAPDQDPRPPGAGRGGDAVRRPPGRALRPRAPGALLR